MANDAKLGDKSRELGIGPEHETIPELAADFQKQRVREAIDNIRAGRRKNGRATAEEILQWRDERRR